jgi:hypothetical protein
MMETSIVDQSHSAEIERLKANQAALEQRIGAIEPVQAAPKPDIKAERAAKAEREKQLSDLKQKFAERQQLLTRLDELVAELVEFSTAERVLRHDTFATHGPLIDKELRRMLKNDSAIIDAISRRLRETVQPSTDLQQPNLATHGEQMRARIMHVLGTPADDLSDLM